MVEDVTPQKSPPPREGFSVRQVLAMIAVSTCIAVVITVITIKIFLFPSPFTPVTLSMAEERQLATKLAVFEEGDNRPRQQKDQFQQDGTLTPEKYSEESEARSISFTERELNALLAKNTDLADKLAVDLADDMVSIKLLLPIDPDFPMLGGQTIRVKAGAELAYRNGRPVVKLAGVSLMGVPIPNAWLGGLKNIDLVARFGADKGGGWDTFANGIDSIHVVDGQVNVRLKE